MLIRWYGHSCFAITTAAGTRIVIDPFDGTIGYDIPRVEADVVLVTHDHYDHNYTDAMIGDPEIINTPVSRNFKDVSITTVSTFHDDLGGEKRGPNIVFVIEADGLRMCHLGDLGHVLTRNQLAEIGRVDVLFIPVGGVFTINACSAMEVVNQLKPKVVIPMHFKTPDEALPVDTADKFLEKAGGAECLANNFIELEADDLPEEMKVIVLNYK
jgi:L-ascorbate metabolism protein UlaG (beta-lactamase superfamily)